MWPKSISISFYIFILYGVQKYSRITDHGQFTNNNQQRQICESVGMTIMMHRQYDIRLMWWLCLLAPQGIISDLFPGVVLPNPDYEVLLQAINDNMAKLRLQPVPWFIGKIIQVCGDAVKMIPEREA